VYFVEEASYSDWCDHLQKCQKINLLQSWQYGNAKQEVSKWNVNRFLIMDDQKNIVGIAQVLSFSLPLIGGLVRMNRGPLLIGSNGQKQNSNTLHKVIIALLGEFKKRRWWLAQIAPEANYSKSNNDFLKNIGFKKLALTPYSSGLLNLEASEEKLLMGLKKKWRYSLKKSQSDEINISIVDGNSQDCEMLVKQYTKFKMENDFSGIPDSLVSSLAAQKAKGWEFNIIIAKKVSSLSIMNCNGMLVSICHGDTSTYFIGVTNNEGRELQVNYLLLWQAILHAKSIGCKWFDIGGLDATTPKGIAHFKKGLQAEPYALIGEWRGFILPWKNIKTKNIL
jgi:lipid II:glycine glycyltransferase (peptidoglycan interpeptide bridge formation enzyme)